MIDARAIRLSLNLTQEQFAERFGLSTSTLRQWEQGRQTPDRAARALLLTISRDPIAVENALKSS